MIKEYKEFKERILFENEVIQLPATQIHVERILEREKERELSKQRVEVLTEELKQLEIEYSKKREVIWQKIRIERNGGGPSVIKEESKREFIRQCPNNDCRGFLSSSLKCKLCDMWSCADCREIKGTERDSEHTCNPDVLINVQAMEKDTKPCPACGDMIYKISGCAQMWHEKCNTAFNWNTLRIETGTIHNPHYFEFMRRQGAGIAPRTPGDFVCGRDLDHHFVREVYNITSNEEVGEILRNTLDIKHDKQRTFRTRVVQDKNLQLRIDYMRNRISEDQLKIQVQQRDKKEKKYKEIFDILEMYIQCMTDISYRLYDKYESGYIDRESRDIKTTKKFHKEIETLREFTNVCFVDISKAYACKKYTINEKYEFV